MTHVAFSVSTRSMKPFLLQNCSFNFFRFNILVHSSPVNGHNFNIFLLSCIFHLNYGCIFISSILFVVIDICVCLCILFATSLEGQKRVLYSLKLKLQSGLSHWTGALGTKFSLFKSSKHLYH